MRPWNEIIAEAKDKKNMTAAEIRKAGEAALKDEQSKNKKEKNKKQKSEYTEYLKKQLEFKKQKYEEQKKKELENLKKKGTEKHKKGIQSSLSGVKTQTISSKDKDPTAYTKAVGNAASLAGGLAKAAIHGVGYLAAKKKAEAAKSSQPEKKEPGVPGRPKQNKSTGEVTSSPKKSATKQITGAPEPKLLSPQRKRLGPATPSGGVPEGSRGPKAKTLGQRARQNPKIKAALIQKSINEELSNWREEFIFEVEDKKDKKKKEKIIEVLPPDKTNKIEINPNIKEERDEEGGMAHNELATMERAVKTLRKKIKSPNQQLPAWVQSKISKAADHIDTVADYMSGETEPVSEECGCEDDEKKVLAMMIIKKAVDAKKKKNFQLNSGIIGEAKTAAWQRKEGKNPKGGLNEKGRKSYEEENPNSNLQAPQPEGGPRKRSFCARMGGMPGPMKDEQGRPTRKALSLRKWKC
jgi:hypothetical protein